MLQWEGQGEDEDLLSIVHDGSEVIRKAQSVAIFDFKVLFFTFKQKNDRKHSSNQTFIKVWYCPSNETCAAHMLTLQDAVPLDCDVLIPILAGVFVVQSQRVHDLVAKIPHSADLGEVHRLLSSLATDKGCTTRRETQTKENSAFIL